MVKDSLRHTSLTAVTETNTYVIRMTGGHSDYINSSNSSALQRQPVVSSVSTVLSVYNVNICMQLEALLQ